MKEYQMAKSKREAKEFFSKTTNKVFTVSLYKWLSVGNSLYLISFPPDLQ